MSFDEIPMKPLMEITYAICGSDCDTWLALAFLPAMAGLVVILAIGFAPWP